MPTTDTQVNDLIINVLTEQQYEQIQQPSDTELYLVPEIVDTTPTQNSTNPITSGAVYDALQGIPAVNDATLTIQKNGTTVDTFSANASQNKTINITVPSEITAQNPLSADLVTDGTTNKVFTLTEKTKLAGIEAGAEVNVQSDWNQSDNTADDYIKNKPTIIDLRAEDADAQTGKMGYKILDPTLTFAEQVTETDTIYEIRDVFDLGGTNDGVNVNVTIPNNCTLKFNGGRLKNGRIELNNCYIDSESVCFEKDVTFGIPISDYLYASHTTSIRNTTIYARWFDFISADDEFTDYATATRNMNPTDNRFCFKQLQSIISDGKNVEFKSNQYLQSSIEENITVNNVSVTHKQTILYFVDLNNVSINLNGTTIKALYSASVKHNIIHILNCNIEIYNGNLVGMAYGFDYPVYTDNGGNLSRDYEYHLGIAQRGGKLSIHDMELSWFTGDAGDFGSGSRIWQTGYYLVGNYIIKDCIVHDCGRNGIILASSEYGIIDNVIIHDIGRGNEDYISGPANIYPRNPKAGIDIEFEDQAVPHDNSYEFPAPVLQLSNLNIYNVYAKTITCSNNPMTKVKSFELTNSELSGAIQLQYITGGKSVCSNCHIKGKGHYFGSSGIVYNDCNIEVDASAPDYLAIYSLSATFNNCKFTDYSDSSYNFPIVDDNENGVFNNCIFDLHKWYSNGVYNNCTISITVQLYYKQPTFINCTIQNTLLGGGSSTGKILKMLNCHVENMSTANFNYKVNCIKTTFKNSKINGDGNSGGLTEFTFIDCVFDEFHLKTTGTGTERVIRNCKGTMSIRGTVELFENNILSFIDIGSSFPAISLCNLKKVYNSVIDDKSASKNPQSSYKGTIVAYNSVLNLSKNWDTNYFTLTGCIINSDATKLSELGFLGSQTNCIFSTPIPTHGDSTVRPTASSMPNTYSGFIYFDETLGMPSFLKVSIDNTDPNNPVYTKSWVKADGSPLS